MGVCYCPGNHDSSKVQNFTTKNVYNPQRFSFQQNIKMILDRIAPGQTQQFYKNLAAFILQQEEYVFKDTGFMQLQQVKDKNNKSQFKYLDKLYNFQKLKLQKVYKTTYTNSNAFRQQQVQFCYLNCVFYLICQSSQLKESIFITKYINNHGAYIVRLFCNGKPENVVVDLKLPVKNGNLQYLQMSKPQQIWPFLLQKAWCKQIGNYDKSKGLSPQDCFQQITGIPARSIKTNRYHPTACYVFLKQSLKKNYWIVLTAHEYSQKIASRQVFKLENINQQTQQMILRSPFQNFQFTRRSSKQLDSTSIQMPYSEMISKFQYITVGYFIEGYVPSSYSFFSTRHQQKIFILQITQPGQINIRIAQFYKQYLSNVKKEIYRYSPVLIQLYDDRYMLIQKCEGRVQNLSGLRSANFSEQALLFLRQGTYYLRVQIQWLSQNQMNEANLVVYSRKNTVKISQCFEKTMQIFTQLMTNTLQKSQAQEIQNQVQQIRIRCLSKCFGNLLGIKNLSNNKSKLSIYFKNSQNIRINHDILKNKYFQLELEGYMERILQILPEDPQKKFYLAPFQIDKL